MCCANIKKKTATEMNNKRDENKLLEFVKNIINSSRCCGEYHSKYIEILRMFNESILT